MTMWLKQIHEALLNLVHAKLRSSLTLLGVLVGTASVVAMVSVGELATHEALKQFKTLGTDLLSISISDGEESSHNDNLSLTQAFHLSSIDSNILDVAPYVQIYNPIHYNEQQINGSILGVTDSFKTITHLELMAGRSITLMDNYTFYCVIGNKIYQTMKKFTFLNPIGQQIRIGNELFTIIGVANPWPENNFVYANLDNAILVPLLATQLLSKYAAINNIIIRLNPNANIDQVKNHVTSYINQQVSHKNLYIRSAKELVERMSKQSAILTLFLSFIGGISLLVGGIGVMNIMLVSVTERRREIGIRMAVGATPYHIRTLFLIEAITLSLIGGILGIIIGVTTAYLIAYFSHWEFTLLLLPPVIGFTISVAVGIFFGFYPAHRAAKLDPIVALKAE